DYYRLQAFFAAFKPIDAALAEPEALARYRQQLKVWEEKTAAIRRRLGELDEPYRNKFIAARKFRFPKEYQAMYDVSADKRTPFQQQMAAMIAKQLEPTADELAKSM